MKKFQREAQRKSRREMNELSHRANLGKPMVKFSEQHDPDSFLPVPGAGSVTFDGRKLAPREATSPFSFSDPVAYPRNWPEDFHLENGNYSCFCVVCHLGFIGHKRRAICKVCATPKPSFWKRLKWFLFLGDDR